MDDDELTRLAYAELLKDAERFKQRENAEFRATQVRAPLKTNKRFLSNTIKSAVTFNRHLDGSKSDLKEDKSNGVPPSKATDRANSVEENDEIKVPQKKRILTSPKKSTLKQEGICHRFNLRKKTNSIKISIKKLNTSQSTE